MASNFLALNPTKTDFILLGTAQQLAKLDNPHLILSTDLKIKPATSVKNLGVTIDSELSYHDHITKTSQACFYHIRDLRRLRSYLDLETASTIGTALVQSKLDYCNSLFTHLPSSEIHRLQIIQNSLARAVYRRSKFCYITSTCILKSLQWLKVKERIVYKTLSFVYKILTNSCPEYLSCLIALQRPGSTRSSKLITLNRPAPISNRAVADRAFQFSAPQI